MKKILLILIAAACSQLVHAQKGGGNFTMSYPISFPMGDLKEYISNASFRGVSLEFNKRVKPNLEVGLETSWNVFYEEKGETEYKQGTASITGKQFRYTNAVPMILGAKWIKTVSNPRMAPFFGLGLGTTYVERAADFGLYRLTQDAWQFCIRPELGFRMDTGAGVAWLLGVKYYGNFGTDDLDGQSYLSLNIGFVFSNR